MRRPVRDLDGVRTYVRPAAGGPCSTKKAKGMGDQPWSRDIRSSRTNGSAPPTASTTPTVTPAATRAQSRWSCCSTSAATSTTWDPALIDALAAARRVVTFDNAGVGGSTGTTPAPSIRWHATPSHSWPPWVQPDRPARLLHRQLRRAADHAGTPGTWSAGWSWPPRRRRARLACTAGHPRSSARSVPRYQPEAYVDVFFTRPPGAGKQASKRSGACMPGPRTGTRPPRGRREAKYDAVLAWGILITHCYSG